MPNQIDKNLSLIILGVLLALVTLACAGLPFLGRPVVSRQDAPALPTGGDGSLENGARIYYSASNAQGERIDYSGGPPYGGMMMGQYLTCAACHGPEARGGTHYMHMQVMTAPDIRISALAAEESEEHQGEESQEEGHTTHPEEYNLDTFRQAVVEGEHPDGDALSTDMPRWQINDDDLADLYAFLDSIP